MPSKTYPISTPGGANAFRTVTFTTGRPAHTNENVKSKFTGTIVTAGRVYVTILCSDGEKRAFRPDQLVQE